MVFMNMSKKTEFSSPQHGQDVYAHNIIHYSLLIAARPSAGAVAGHAVNGCDLLCTGLDANQQSKRNKPNLARQDGAENVAAQTL